MRNLIMYMIILGCTFAFVPMLAENVVSSANYRYITQLEDLNKNHTKDELLSIDINYDNCIKILNENDIKSPEYNDCISGIVNSKIKLYMSK